MEIRHLNTFLQVAKVNNFTKAAEILGYSQSNVSLHILQLEEDAGVPLFDRVGKKATLTQYGRALVPYAQTIVSTAEHIQNLFQDQSSLGGVLRVGFVESVFECVFSKTFSRYHQLLPNVTVEVTVDATSELLKKLRTSELDIACVIDNFALNPDIHCWDSAQCGIVVVANPNHPLAGRGNLKISDLSQQEFVLVEDTAPYVVDFQKMLFKENVQIRSYLKVQSPKAVLELVSQEKLLSFLPEYSLKKAFQTGAVTKLALSDLSFEQSVQFLTHKNKVLTPQIESFLHEVYKTFLDFATEQ